MEYIAQKRNNTALRVQKVLAHICTYLLGLVHRVFVIQIQGDSGGLKVGWG